MKNFNIARHARRVGGRVRRTGGGSSGLDAAENNGPRLRHQIGLHKPQIILVDYFDTVVTRSVHRKRVKPIVARHVKERLGIQCDVNALQSARRTAEQYLRARSVADGLDPEHRLDDMAAEIWSILERDHSTRTAVDRDSFVAAWAKWNSVSSD